MRIISFSDLHSEEHEDFSYQLDNGMNSRLADCLNVIDRVAYYRDKYECEVVLNAGDTFHTPQVLPTIVFQETFKKLKSLAESSKHFVVLAGNHDMASITADGIPVSSVYALGSLPNTKVIVGKYLPVSIDGVVFNCLPYIKDSVQLDNNVARIDNAIRYPFPLPGSKYAHNIVVTHIGLDQAVNGPNEIKLRNSYAISKLRKLGADKILSGHHHHPEDHGDWSVIGSPLQHNMLDRGDKRGLLIYDTKTKATKRIWLSGSRFFLYEVDSVRKLDALKRDADNAKFAGGYVRVKLTSGIASEEKVEGIVRDQAKMYKILLVSESKTEVRNEDITSKAIANIGNLSVVVQDYVEHLYPKGLNHKRLISIGKRLLQVPGKG